ncbi:hypothetical protein BV898_01859 [Hypsibius exemplaris]|uniref:Renin receptor-like C-terminal transmembrane spanning segment domain-containing protein n=1 Tax=Hypsibius exemplaris TaxID=2072580 RepID=A0A1W0XA88_HYPEX|nr:hypothetical protein BV898_01859 [Hypsibius exemplaris]
MESRGFLVLCLAAAASLVHCRESTVSSDIRDYIGLGSSASSSSARPETVFVFLTANESGSATGGINDGDLLAVAGDLEQRDPHAIFAHYNGDSLITSHASLFDDLDNVVGDASFTAVLERVKGHQKRGTLADLVVLQGFPDSLQTEISQLCDSTKKCKVVSAYLNDNTNHARFRRADPVTTPAPTPLGPKDRANIPYDSVAAFHLLFWTSLAIALTVWGTAYGMWHMDPGRDSIIYRMTSAQKFKKDK